MGEKNRGSVINHTAVSGLGLLEKFLSSGFVCQAFRERPVRTGIVPCTGGQLVYKFQLRQRNSPQPRPQTPACHPGPNHIISGPKPHAVI